MALFSVESAQPSDRERALRLLFQHFDAAERETKVKNALTLMHAGSLDPDGLLIVRDEANIIGAMISMVIPGAGSLVWPPQTQAAANASHVADALVNRAVDWLRGQCARLGQALLAPNETSLADPLERNGFRHVTALEYMRRDTKAEVPALHEQRLKFQPFEACESSEFARTLMRTYQGTRDCPEVNGIRTIEEIMDGHKADAGANFQHWWLARKDQEPIGLLLANETTEWEAWEIAYVGVIPEARGRGHGSEIMVKAILEAQSAEVPQLTLCVDSRNVPARIMYRQLGFETYDTREIYLAVWNPADAHQQPFHASGNAEN